MDSVSVASSTHRRFKGNKRISSELSEPLTTASSVIDESLGSEAGDPYFMFRADLQKKLELVDESLADFLRVVHETVCFVASVQFGRCHAVMGHASLSDLSPSLLS